MAQLQPCDNALTPSMGGFSAGAARTACASEMGVPTDLRRPAKRRRLGDTDVTEFRHVAAVCFSKVESLAANCGHSRRPHGLRIRLGVHLVWKTVKPAIACYTAALQAAEADRCLLSKKLVVEDQTAVEEDHVVPNSDSSTVDGCAFDGGDSDIDNVIGTTSG